MSQPATDNYILKLYILSAQTYAISDVIGFHVHLYKLVQCCTTLKSQKVIILTSYVLILKSSSHWDHVMVSYAHYILSAWSEVHLYPSKHGPNLGIWDNSTLVRFSATGKAQKGRKLFVVLLMCYTVLFQPSVHRQNLAVTGTKSVHFMLKYCLNRQVSCKIPQKLT